MSFFRITENLTPKDLKARLSKMLKRSKDIRPWLRVAGLQVLSSVQLNFRYGGRPKWPGLKLATLLSRQAGPGGAVGRGKPLLDTGRLANSIITGNDNPGAVGNPNLKSGGNMLRLTRRAIQIGTNVSYAAIHQFGIGVVARPFLVIQKRDVVFMKLAAEEFIKGDL